MKRELQQSKQEKINVFTKSSMFWHEFDFGNVSQLKEAGLNKSGDV